MNQPQIVVGVISDTHGLLRPEAAEAPRGAELILHAGDVGKAEVLDRLREIGKTGCRLATPHVSSDDLGRNGMDVRAY
jgi:predicted phosphodiesterase